MAIAPPQWWPFSVSEQQLDSAGGFIGKSVIGQIGGQIVGSVFSPVTRAVQYEANYRNRFIVPSPTEIIHALYIGAIDQDQASHWLGYHAVDYRGTSPVRENRQALWQSIIDGGRPTYDLGLWRKWHRQGRVNEREVRDAFKRHGFPVEEVQNWFLDDRENISNQVALRLWLLRIITDDQLRDAMRLSGIVGTQLDQVKQSAAVRPGVSETLELLNRGYINDFGARNLLRASGIIEEPAQAQFLELRHRLPSAADIVATQGHLATNAEFARKWRLDAEKPTYFDEWMARIGLDTVGADGLGLKWSDAFWRDHWRTLDLPALSQVIRRFRGDPNNEDSWSVPGVQPLSDNDIQELLRANGIAPAARSYYTAMLYAPLSIRHIRWAVESEDERVDREWVKGKLQDGGMQPTDADLIADITIKQAEDKKHRAAKQKYIHRLIEAYLEGVTNEAQIRQALTTAGVDSVTQNYMLTEAQIRRYQRIAKQIERRAKADYFAGRTNQAGAFDRLIRGGIDRTYAELVIRGWEAERGEGRIRLSTDRTLRLLRKGYINYGEALQRLENLGWARPDELLLLAEVEGEIAKDAAAADKAAATNASKIEKAILEVHKAAERNAEKLSAALRRATPVSKIVKWVERGLWTLDDARKRMRLMGYDDKTIDTYLKDIILDLADKAAKDAAKVAKQ